MGKHFELRPGGFSILVVTAKPAFVEWLQQLAARESTTVERLYDPVMTGVWLIPRIGSLDEDLVEYLERLKPTIARHEFGSYGELPVNIEGIELFDRYFVLEVRQDAFVAPDV